MRNSHPPAQPGYQIQDSRYKIRPPTQEKPQIAQINADTSHPRRCKGGIYSA